jgi:uncharacterized membrane protein YdjX (TVP38/TMEM64 family)
VSRRWPRWALAAFLVLAVAGFFAFGLHRSFSWESLRGNLDAWKEQAGEHRALAVAVYFAVYVAVTALSLPAATPLTLAGGALFGRWLGTAVVSLASTLGATLAFWSSRYVLGDWVQRRFAGRLGPINRGIERDGAWYLLSLRLIPAVPYFLINLGMGLTPMRSGTYAAVSWLGMLPGTFLYVNVGAELATFDPWKVLAALALLALVPLAVRVLVRRK